MVQTAVFSYLGICIVCFYLLSYTDPEQYRYTPLWYVPADTVDILFAESVEKTVKDELPVQILKGSVRLMQDSTLLNADLVTRFLTQDEILLEGNVLIIQENDSIFADNVRYDTELKIGYATGNVRLSDGEVEVLSPSATHFVDEKRTLFDQDVQLIDSLTVLTSNGGEYFSEPKRAEFFGDVALEEDNTYLRSDSVTYFRETEVSLGYGNVFIERIEMQDQDTSTSTSRTFIFGDYVFNDNQRGYSSVEGNAFLFQVQVDSLGSLRDSLFIESNRLEAIQLDSLDRLIAVDSVSIWQRNFSAIADSAVYDRVRIWGEVEQVEVFYEENRLFEDPVAWYNEYQLSGDSLLATAYDESIDSLFTSQNAFVAFFDTTTQKINQLKGESLVGIFAQDSLENLTIGPQAEAIYYQQPEEDQLGAIKASGDRIVLDFDGNELSNINVYAGIEAEYYDGGLIPDPFTLTGYRWLIEQKPIERMMLDRIPSKDLINARLIDSAIAVSEN